VCYLLQSPKKKRKSSTSRGRLPSAVSEKLHKLADEIMPRRKTAMFRELKGKVLRWRDLVVMRAYRWCQENGYKDVKSKHLSSKLAG
jgi:hypothetical protein